MRANEWTHTAILLTITGGIAPFCVACFLLSALSLSLLSPLCFLLTILFSLLPHPSILLLALSPSSVLSCFFFGFFLFSPFSFFSLFPSLPIASFRRADACSMWRWRYWRCGVGFVCARCPSDAPPDTIDRAGEATNIVERWWDQLPSLSASPRHPSALPGWKCLSDDQRAAVDLWATRDDPIDGCNKGQTWQTVSCTPLSQLSDQRYTTPLHK